MELQSFDDILIHIGTGRWTLFMFSSYVLWALLLPYFSLGGAFYNPQVDHWCRVPELDNSSWTLEQKLNYSIPWKEEGGRLERSQCTMYVRNYSAVASQPWSSHFQISPEEESDLLTKPCQQWHYDTSTFNSTVTMEWDLVCDKGSLSPFFGSFYFFGTAVGEPLLGFFADKYGRRSVLIATAILFLVTATSCILVPLYSLVLAGRFILGMIHGIIGPAYIHGMEACPPKFRTVFGLLSTAPFAFTGIVFGSLAYFIRDWRTLHLICTLPVSILLLQIPLLNESPRWLVQQSRQEEAARTLQRAAKWQGVLLPPPKELMLTLENLCEQNVHAPANMTQGVKVSLKRRLAIWWKDTMILVSTPVLRRITFALFACWFCVGVTYWGMSLSGVTFSTDPFLFMILSSLMEIPGYTGFIPVVARFGRRSVLSFNFAVCSAAILTTLATPKSYTWVVFALALMGKLFITGSYGLLYLVTSELFPTCVRSRGLNLSSVMARLGSVMSPFIIELLATSYWWSPAVTFGVCASLGSCFALLVPDSSHKPLADTVEELELLYGKSSNSYDSAAQKRLFPHKTEEEEISSDGTGV